MGRKRGVLEETDLFMAVLPANPWNVPFHQASISKRFWHSSMDCTLCPVRSITARILRAVAASSSGMCNVVPNCPPCRSAQKCVIDDLYSGARRMSSSSPGAVDDAWPCNSVAASFPSATNDISIPLGAVGRGRRI
jgi:hypothetical protein